MKNNIFGYLFIIFIIVIMSFAIYKVKKEDSQKKSNTENNIAISTEEKGKEIVLAVSGFDTINPIITKNKKYVDNKKGNVYCNSREQKWFCGKDKGLFLPLGAVLFFISSDYWQ